MNILKLLKWVRLHKEFVESDHSVTPTIVVSEISRKLRKDFELGNENSEGRLWLLEFIRATSRIVDLDFEIAVEAGGIRVLCTARSLKRKVVTEDEHFRHFPDVVFVKI